jgi:hypothetical protein
VRPGPVHKRRDGQHPAGDFAEGRQVARDALRRPGIARRAELAALIVDTLGQSLSLDLENFEGILARGLDLAEELHAEEPLATDQLLLTTAEVRCYQDPAAVLALAVERGRPDSPLLGTWRMVTSMVTLMTGDITTAVVASHEALLLMERSDPFANLSMVGSVHGVALAQSGSTDPLGDLRTASHDFAGAAGAARTRLDRPGAGLECRALRPAAGDRDSENGRTTSRL